MTLSPKPAKKKAATPKPAKKPVTTEPASYRTLTVWAFACVAMLVLGMIAGVYSAGADNVSPWAPADVLDGCHKADRVSQLRILTGFVGQQFASDSEAQQWINSKRAEARTSDWIPYTDALGKAIEAEQVPEFIRSLGGKP
jgi:hypothetical protein